MSFIPTTIEALETFSKENSNTLLFISFKASWCKPCKEIKPFIDYLKEQYKNVNFYDIDIEDEDVESITNYFNIKKVPTFIYYKNGITCNSIIGTNKEIIEEYINEYL
jgi:thioredoxin 1